MRIFVGGPLHGTEHLAPLTKDAGGSVMPAEHPPLYADLATGAQYITADVTHTSVHPVTGLPLGTTYRNTVYVLAGLQGDTQQMMNAVADAVLRWWFISHGSTEPGPAASNGTGPPRPSTMYAASCAHCVPVISLVLFETLGERAQWMQAHIDEQGHAPSHHLIEQPIPESPEGQAHHGS